MRNLVSHTSLSFKPTKKSTTVTTTTTTFTTTTTTGAAETDWPNGLIDSDVALAFGESRIEPDLNEVEGPKPRVLDAYQKTFSPSHDLAKSHDAADDREHVDVINEHSQQQINVQEGKIVHKRHFICLCFKVFLILLYLYP